ncbi:transposase [uncultured Sporomusa sp.]|nr:transposase [uncultured Sporomusa sp.]
MVALESTSFYGIHIANYLSSCKLLMPFHTHVYCLNPKMIANYKKSYIDLGKNDGIDAFVIADFARVAELLLPLGVAASFSLCNA